MRLGRRALITRTVTSGFSATVFTAVGWLMGTRALTMTIKADPEPACCADGVTMGGHVMGPFCINVGSPCPPEGGSGSWGTCVADCYKYYCEFQPGTWCFTYCLDVYGLCCFYTDCPAP